MAQALFGVSSNDHTTVPVAINSVTSQQVRHVRYLDVLSLCESYVAEAFQAFLQKLTNLGVVVERVTPDDVLLRSIRIIYQIISYAEGSSNMGAINGVAFGNGQHNKD